MQPGAPLDRDAIDAAVTELLDALERGELRAAERGADGCWNAVAWVKAGIMLAFRIGELVEMGHVPGSAFRFFDRHPFSLRDLSLADGIRLLCPVARSFRRGAYVSPGVIRMLLMLIDIGAYVDANTTIDSHALVGCAQVGARVHLSAAAQLGGVLEPAHAAPVIVEDEVFIGGNCGVYEGTVVRRRAVLASGVILTRATPVYSSRARGRAPRGERCAARDSRGRRGGARCAPDPDGVGRRTAALAPDADHCEVPRRAHRRGDRAGAAPAMKLPSVSVIGLGCIGGSFAKAIAHSERRRIHDRMEHVRGRLCAGARRGH